MAESFHEKPFGSATQTKLAIFRGYIREWLSVFLTAWKTGANPTKVNVFDFFAGPGTDAEGNPGSPRIIQDELKAYCASRDSYKAGRLKIRLHFNDNEPKYIDELQRCLSNNACDRDCCQIRYLARPFQDALASSLHIMRQRDSANLVIMDQFGVKEVGPEVVNMLAGCSKTDILFFISSSIIHRFRTDAAIQKSLAAEGEELQASEYRWIHRHICDYYRSRLPVDSTYHLAPFSLKTEGGNIYGVIFGSGSLLGLEKFLKVGWGLNGVTGDANYPIDGDVILWEHSRQGQMPLLFSEEDRVSRKMALFHRELEHLIRIGAGRPEPAPSVNNRDMYRFTLERGFLPKHANEHLKELQDAGQLHVIDLQSRKPARKASFYLNYKHYASGQPRVVFQLQN